MSPEELGLPWLDLGKPPQISDFSLDSVEVTAYPMPSSRKESVQKNMGDGVSKKQRQLLLGKISNDLDYLEYLVNEVKIGEMHEHDSGGRIIRNEAKDAITFLQGRQHFWSQYKPMYSK